jgi:hypothetical protein
MEVAQAEACIIQRVFDAYVGGQSPRAIGKRTNIEMVRGPRGDSWTVPSLFRNEFREPGLLRNWLYIGERLWNR